MFLEPRYKHMLLAVLPPAKTSPLGLVSFWKENTATPEDLNDSMSIMTPRLNLGGKNQGHYLHIEPKEMEPIVDLPRATHDHLTGASPWVVPVAISRLLPQRHWCWFSLFLRTFFFACFG